MPQLLQLPLLLFVLLLQLIQRLRDRMQARVFDERVKQRERNDHDAVGRDGQRAVRGRARRTDRATGLGGLCACVEANDVA